MGLPAGGVLGIKLAHEADGLVAMDVVKPESYLWSVTDNGLAKATAMDEYPTQGRYGQGVINVRLPKDAAEVAAAVIISTKDLVILTTALGSTKKLKISDGTVGSRSIKPRPIVRIGTRNRVTGAVMARTRPNELEEGAVVVPQQMSLLDDAQPSSTRRKTKTKA